MARQWRCQCHVIISDCDTGDGLPSPLLSIILAPLVCGDPVLLAHYPALAWPGISNINPLFDYLRGQLGPGEVVSLTPYITERGEALQQTLETGEQ